MINMNKRIIANNLRSISRSHDLTQMDLAQLLGIQSTNRISRWENGLSYPHVPNLMKILEIYEVGVREVYLY